MDTMARPVPVRHMLYRHLDPAARSGEGLSAVNRAICGLIVLSAAFAILETEDRLFSAHEPLFATAEWAFTAAFGLEYIGRVWCCVENPRYGPGLRGRLRYVLSPAAVIDLLALLPIVLTVGGSEAFLLRLFRLLRILRLARLGRFSDAMERLWRAVVSRRHELLLSFCGGGMVLIASSTLMYLAECDAQPDNFGSIPRAMWWAIVTLTTVGYGDVYPVTVLGRALAALTAVTGIALIAMPAGILAAAFSDSTDRDRAAAKRDQE